ncbi:MAG: FKBP-type peptidyl-prolyl cis-trans isomerase [Coriobacteriia bacterium]|nr:FKBP-type peptidyl-prolyl cis-trans isomerase [Coriobacteriia bacterium]
MQKKIWENILVGIMAIALLGSAGYFYFNSKKPVSTEYDMKQIAASVDGIDIREADVAYMIDTMRSDYYGTLLSDEEWAQSLQNGDFTPETLREYVIKNHFAVQIMIINDAAELGIYPDSDAIDLRLTEQKAAFGNDASWLNYLRAIGFADEASYRRFLEAQDVVSPLINEMFGDSEPTDKEIYDYFVENGPYLTGRRSSAIVIDYDDDNLSDAILQAVAALQALEAGEDFASVADRYSITEQELEPGGDMGWKVLTQLPWDYYAALDELEVGEISGIVDGEDCLYIIYCTDYFEFDEDSFEVSQVPSEIYDRVIEYLPAYLVGQRPDKYFEDLMESDRIVIYPMPTGLAYDVDMSQLASNELEIIDTVIGTGPEAEEGDLLRVTYVGTLEDGTVFDASYLHEPGYFEFVLGYDNVIEGWHQGMAGMQVGGVRTLIVPSNLAYGSSGSGSIPPYATITFEIELLSINGEPNLDDISNGGENLDDATGDDAPLTTDDTGSESGNTPAE